MAGHRHEYSERDDIVVQQSKAAWAAVHEARRGISAAWTSVLINTVIVITALGVPYLQKYLDRQKDVEDRVAQQAYLLHDAARDMKEIEATYNKPLTPLERPDDLISENMRGFIIDGLQVIRDDIDRQRVAQNYRIADLVKYPALLEFVDIEDNGFAIYSDSMARAQLMIRHAAVLKNRDVSQILEEAQHDPALVDAIKLILINVEANVDPKTGQPSRKEMQIVSCKDEVWKSRCHAIHLNEAASDAFGAPTP
ncbi:MAG: hypothetical protein JOY99_07545 [Sphingomonadaceae bacterium]|nr:hypothetical protein [Sphingomonadaceae bacterium]